MSESRSVFFRTGRGQGGTGGRDYTDLGGGSGSSGLVQNLVSVDDFREKIYIYQNIKLNVFKYEYFSTFLYVLHVSIKMIKRKKSRKIF